MAFSAPLSHVVLVISAVNATSLQIKQDCGSSDSRSAELTFVLAGALHRPRAVVPPLGEHAHWNLAFTALMCGTDPILYFRLPIPIRWLIKLISATSGSSGSGGRPIRFAFSHAVDQIGAGDTLTSATVFIANLAGSPSRFFCPRSMPGKMTLQADILKEAAPR
jgi:hypothetical protein